jgi:hypothetical protein
MEFTIEQLDTVVDFARQYLTPDPRTGDVSTVAEAIGIVRFNLRSLGSPLADECDDLWSAARIVMTNADGITPVD